MKPLTFRGAKKSYVTGKEGNMLVTSDCDVIKRAITGISAKMPQIKVIVIDTISSIMSDMEMAELKKKSFDKWIDYAASIYELYQLAQDPSLRQDLFIIFVGHTEQYNDNGITRQRLKTGGSKLTKMNIEGKVSYTFYTDIEFQNGKPEYYFLTQSDGTNTARTPEGCFEYRIPNDLDFILKRISEYESE